MKYDFRLFNESLLKTNPYKSNVYSILKLKRRKYMYRDEKGGRFGGSPREMHKVTCAECGKETEVPFKPDGSRPVYCRECFQKHKRKRF